MLKPHAKTRNRMQETPTYMWLFVNCAGHQQVNGSPTNCFAAKIKVITIISTTVLCLLSLSVKSSSNFDLISLMSSIDLNNLSILYFYTFSTLITTIKYIIISWSCIHIRVSINTSVRMCNLSNNNISFSYGITRSFPLLYIIKCKTVPWARQTHYCP